MSDGLLDLNWRWYGVYLLWLAFLVWAFFYTLKKARFGLRAELNWLRDGERQLALQDERMAWETAVLLAEQVQAVLNDGGLVFEEGDEMQIIARHGRYPLALGVGFTPGQATLALVQDIERGRKEGGAV